jgi:hypothetical protein
MLVGKVVALSNADIYFDASVACAGLLRREKKVVLALSRHPSPDCVDGSGHGQSGREPQDLCQGYHPVQQASHDVFIFIPPLPAEFIDAIDEDIRVNVMGAENLIIYLLEHFAQVTVLNPCGNIHAFHAHCDARARADSAKASQANIGSNPAMWAGPSATGVDCLLYGLKRPGHFHSLRNESA